MELERGTTSRVSSPAQGFSTAGCCRYNELIYLDVFKFSALCALLYACPAAQGSLR